ncbi:MAG: epoxyqueuosine reductase QueH [Spirochaetes bacterium]|nr:epoxyqueuosine reductase QueH [Spirochaetota bacterium]
MKKDDILLHTCCAPCVTHVQDLLANAYRVVSFYYNPNIHPRGEYEKRLGELRRFSNEKGFPVITGDYDARAWTDRIKPHRFEGERSERCRQCIEMRLERSFEKAREESIGMVGTTLTVSPHKDAAMINALGRELSRRFGIDFLESDFKKNDGYRRSAALARQYGLYRQNYCGCVYSMHDRYRGR